jgi:hypothetical protein
MLKGTPIIIEDVNTSFCDKIFFPRIHVQEELCVRPKYFLPKKIFRGSGTT